MAFGMGLGPGAGNPRTAELTSNKPETQSFEDLVQHQTFTTAPLQHLKKILTSYQNRKNLKHKLIIIKVLL